MRQLSQTTAGDHGLQWVLSTVQPTNGAREQIIQFLKRVRHAHLPGGSEKIPKCVVLLTASPLLGDARELVGLDNPCTVPKLSGGP